MKNKIQSYVGMRLDGRRLIDTLTTHISPTNHPLKHGVGKYIFSFLLVLTMGIGQMWAADPVENVGTYSTQVISADGTTSTWTFITPSSQVTIPTSPAETEDNDIIFHPGGGSKMKFSSSNGLSWSGNSDGYIYVPAGAAGSISMTVKSTSDSRWLQFYVDGVDQGSTKRLWSKEANPATAARGPRTFTFTSSDLTTKGEKTYLHLKDNNTEMKIATFTVTLTTGTYLTPSCSTEITTQPSGATIAKGDANPELSIVATNVASYAWKESSDGTSYDGSSTLGTSATFTPEVNDAEQTKYYYCEVTSDCDGTTVVKSDIVTINVVGSITYYTVTLVPAGGTIVDATGWTLNAGNYEKEVAEGTELTLPTFTKENRIFKTWRKAGPADVASPITVTEDLTLTAVWTATIEQVIYSWEGAEGGAIETGGTAAGNVDNLINQTSAGYYCLKIDGNNSYSANLVTITLAGEEKVKTGDKIKYWGFYNKSSNANARPKMRDANGSNAAIFDDPNNLPNLNGGGDPAIREFTVPAEINTNAVQITRSQTGSTTWIPKIQIIRETQVEEGDLLTVTFDTKGGSSISPVMVASGQTIAKPADPTKEHNRFNEWQLGGSAYNFSTPVTSSITLDATWTQLYTISFAAGDGSGDAPAAVADKAKDETFEVPANTFTAPEGKEFDKWNDGANDYAPGATYTVGTANVVLTAQWKALTAKYTVIFKDGETTLDTKLFEVGSNPSDADIDKTKPLFSFASWQLSGSDIALDDASWASVAANAEVTLTARWAKAYATSYDMEAYAVSDGATLETLLSNLDAAGYAYTNVNGIDDGHTHNYIYDGMKYKTNDGDLSFNVNAGKLVIVKTGNLPANALTMYINGVADPTVFVGANEAVETHVNNYFYSEAEALYRLDIQASKGTCAIKAVTITNPFQVTFNANGGDPVVPQYGHPAVILPDASNGTKSLLGWFDAAEGGNKIGDVGESYTPAADIELFAQWEDVSTDARLASIEFSSDAGTLEPTFDPEVTSYTYTMPYGTAAIPTITGATSVNAKAQDPIFGDAAAAWGEAQTIQGVAQSGDKKTYTITMVKAPKDGVSIIKATINSTTKNTIGEVTGLYKKDASCGGLSGYKFNGKGAYIGIELVAGQTFNEGDIINIHTTSAAGQGTIALYNDHGNTVSSFHDYGVMGGTGDNKFALPASAEDKSIIYVCRTEANTWNGYVDYIEVTRAMNPLLTAITIDGRAGEIDPLDDKHFNVTIPYEADLANLTIVPTIAWNAPAAENSIVVNDGGAWVEGDNTYKLTDKDGDYTIYTLTLTRDVLKHTVSFNTHGGSAIASEEVEHNGYLAAAPTAPTKEDYLFQYWSLSDGGEEVDIMTVQITENKEFHAVWAPDGAIKLLDGSTVNHTNFITGVTADETVEFQGNTVNYAKFSGTVSGVNGVKDLTRVIAYNATTNKTKIQISAHNNSTSGRSILVKGLVEGASAAVDLATIALGNKEDKVSEWIEFNNAANRTIYIMVSSSAGDVYFTQVKVIESGETPMKQAGEAGYSLNLNKGRFFGPASTDLAFEGLDARLSGDYTALNSGYAKLNATSMSFTVASDMNLVVTTNNSKTYYVTKGAAGTDNETAKTGVSEFDLTAGTWYITAGSSEVQFTNIAFALPKCEQPTVVDMESIGLCEGDAFIALTVSASVSDEGTLHYAWFKEAGATDEAVGTDAASFTPEADGEYYVIVTNQKTGYSDNSETSNTVSVEHFAAAIITTAPADVAKEVGQEATLSVVATGKNCTYEWFTCDDALGTNPVAIVPAETGTSLTVTVAAGEQYYMVVVSSDCGASVSAVAKVAQWRELAPANVTGSMTWDWKSAAWDGITTNIEFANTSVEELMANVNAKVPCVDGANGFRSDMLYGTGQYVWRPEGNRFFQGTKIRFITTVPGKLVVRYRNTSGSTNTRTIKITNNGEVLPADGTNTTNSFKNTNPVVVKAGEVIIEGIASEENGLTRIEKIIFDADLDPTQAEEATLGGYERDVTEGRYGTICLPKDGIMVGAAIFELAYYSESDNKIFMDQVMSGEMVAGRPYIFLPNEGVSTLGVYYTDDEAVAAGDYRGLYGYYNGTDDALQLDPGEGHYILYNNQFREVTVSHVWIDQNRAYFKIGVTGGIPTNVVAPLPGRRRMSIGAAAPQVTTGMDELNAGEAPVKVLINGELFILRGDKMFDATGRLIK